MQQLARELALRIERHAEAETKLRVILEKRVAPRRSAPFSVVRPWSRGKIASVYRGTAGGIGDEETIPEKLGEQLEIRRFAAAGTGPGEFKQRLLHLLRAHMLQRNAAAIEFRQ